MVSALTGRLLANLNSGTVSSSSSSSSSGEGSQRLSSVSAVSQQQSRSSVSPPPPPSCNSIDASTTSSQSSRSLKRSNNEEATSSSSTTESTCANKRQKQCNEKNYAASTAFACLTKAGHKIPTIRSTCPRGLPPLSGVNMGQVSLVHSKNFTPPIFMGSSLMGFNDELCSALIQATSAFYQLPKSSFGSDADCDSNGTSSVTDETASSSGTPEENEPVEKVISMGEALQITKHPRLVTLATAPFNVVHVNAAYLSLTGLPSAVVLGRPFQEIVADQDWTSLVEQEAGGDFELTQLHGASLQAKALPQDAANCGAVKVCVTKIGAQPSKVAHFAVELHRSSANANTSSFDAPIRRAASSLTPTATSFGMVVA